MAKHSRVFVKSGNDLFYLMWAQFETSGDVYMGLTAKGSGGIEQVYDPDLGRLLAGDLVAPQTDEDLKISFHASGQYKLSGRMGLKQDSLDRVSVTGPALADINKPRMMTEILLPVHLPYATRKPGQYDITLDISPGPPPPHRCAIFCMSKQCYEEVLQQTIPLVETSEWECIEAFTDGLQVWAWVIRKSKNDNVQWPRYLIDFRGIPKWGQLRNGRVGQEQ
ncbi:MAG: hypothetical protein ABI955_05905 [Nitrospirota bacterium]